MTRRPTIVNQMLRDYGDVDYSADIISDLISLADVTRTQYANVVLSDNSVAIAAGASRILFTSQFWWYYLISTSPTVYDLSAVDEEVIQAGIVATGAGTDLMSIDIEEWSLLTEYSEAIANLSIAANAWKTGTTRPVGFYRILPEGPAFYTHIVNLRAAITAGNKVDERIWRSLISSWMQLTDRTYADLGQYVSYLSPDCYVVYPSSIDTGLGNWKWFTAFQILEAIRVGQGKPIYPFLWLRTSIEGTLLTEAEFTTAMQYILSFPGVSGVITYSSLEPPTLYTWTDVVAAAVAGTGSFVDS